MYFRSLRNIGFIKILLNILAATTNQIICFYNYSWKQFAINLIVFFLTYTVSAIIMSEFSGFIISINEKFELVNDSMADFVMKGNFVARHNSGYLRYKSDKPDNILRKISIAHFDLVSLTKKVNSTFSLYVLLYILRNLNFLLDSFHTLANEKETFIIFNVLFWSFVTMIDFLYILYVSAKTVTSVSSIYFIGWKV